MMTQAISNFIQTNSRWTLGAAAVGAVVSLELAVRTIHGGAKKASGSEEKNLGENISKSFGGAIFYGLAAANLVPGSAKIGALVFTGYSYYSHSAHKSEDRYFTANLLGSIAKPVLEEAVFPFFQRIWKVVGAILAKITLPKSPVWLGVIVLTTAIVSYNFGPAIIRSVGNEMSRFGTQA